MKNDIKKYLTLGAALAGSAFMVSCDSGSDATPVTPVVPPVVVTPPPVTPPPVTGIGTTITNAAILTARGSGTNSSFLLSFDVDSTMTMFTNTTMITTGFVPPTDIIEQGDTFDLSANSGTVINFTGVTGSGATLTIASLDSPVPADQDYSNLVLTETSNSTIGTLTSSTGTFTMDAEVAVMGGTDLPGVFGIGPITLFQANLATANGTLGPILALNSFPSTALFRPSITDVGAPVFKVAVGDTILRSGVQIFVTDTATPNLTLTDATPHDIGVEGAINVDPGKIILLRNGGTPASTVPLTGTYVFQF